MGKVRVSQHSGREGSARHNDRSFLEDMTPREREEKAPHIRAGETHRNRTWSIGGNGTLRDRELTFYRKRYAAAVEKTNERYRKQGHPERCRTIDQMYTGAKTRPEEMIIQIGDRDAGVDPEVFTDAVREYLRQLETWNAAHGGHMHILDVTIHLDEASPHAHIRRVWDYTDKDGVVRLGQNKALQDAGVSLPHPNKPEGRYNNRKITFDSWARGLWQEIVREHGYEVETEPRPSARHKDKVDFVNERLREATEAADQADRERRATESRIRDALSRADELLAQAQADVAASEARMRALEDVLTVMRESGRLTDRQRHKSLLGGEEHIWITPEEAEALDMAVAVKIPLVEAVDGAQRRIDEILRQTQIDMLEYKQKAQRVAEESKRRLRELTRPQPQRQRQNRRREDPGRDRDI